MKKCIRCGIEKPLEQFHRRSTSRDGRRADCAECNCANVKRRNSTEEAKARKKAYSQTEKYKESKKKYVTSDRGRELNRKYKKEQWRRMNEEQKERHRERCKFWRKTEKGKASKDAERARYIAMGRYRVYHKVLTALRNGTLTKQPCESCGEARAQAHHHDYSMPLDVRWLCAKHHAEEHRQ